MTDPAAPTRHMNVTTPTGNDLLRYIDNLAELAGDGERAVAFTTAWRAIRARLPAIEAEARSTPTEALDVEQPDWLEEAENGSPWKSEGRIEGDDADGVWLANEDGDSLWLSSPDVAWLLNHAISSHNGEAAS